ncbi:unnamed protein product [Linum trigynum]|uniref:Uncharacterized protein n=1 Tax=Linum trigynum TaxID=586398 RepID=A0AAV2FW73_9ROSI
MKNARDLVQNNNQQLNQQLNPPTTINITYTHQGKGRSRGTRRWAAGVDRRRWRDVRLRAEQRRRRRAAGLKGGRTGVGGRRRCGGAEQSSRGRAARYGFERRPSAGRWGLGGSEQRSSRGRAAGDWNGDGIQIRRRREWRREEDTGLAARIDFREGEVWWRRATLCWEVWWRPKFGVGGGQEVD